MFARLFQFSAACRRTRNADSRCHLASRISMVILLATIAAGADEVFESVEEDVSLARLPDMARFAESNHPILRKASAEIEVARGKALQAGLYPNPRFDSGNPQTLAGTSSVYTGGLTQEVVVKGKLRLDRAAALETMRQAELNYIRERFVLATSVRQQFYRILIAQRRIDSLGELVKIGGVAVDSAKRHQEVGEATETDVLLVAIELERVRSNLAKATTVLQGIRRQLSVTIAAPEIDLPVLLGAVGDDYPEYIDDEIRTFLQSENAEIQKARVEIAKNQLLLRRAIVEPCPNFNLTGGYQYSVSPNFNQAVVGVTFPIPVFNRNQGNIRAARSNIRAAVEELSVLEIDLYRLAVDLLTRYRAAKQLAETYEHEIIPDAKRVQANAQRLYSAQQIGVAQFLQTVRTLEEMQLTYLDILDDLWSAAAELSGLLQREQFP